MDRSWIETAKKITWSKKPALKSKRTHQSWYRSTVCTTTPNISRNRKNSIRNASPTVRNTWWPRASTCHSETVPGTASVIGNSQLLISIWLKPTFQVTDSGGFAPKLVWCTFWGNTGWKSVPRRPFPSYWNQNLRSWRPFMVCPWLLGNCEQGIEKIIWLPMTHRWLTNIHG